MFTDDPDGAAESDTTQTPSAAIRSAWNTLTDKQKALLTLLYEKVDAGHEENGTVRITLDEYERRLAELESPH